MATTCLQNQASTTWPKSALATICSKYALKGSSLTNLFRVLPTNNVMIHWIQLSNVHILTHQGIIAFAETAYWIKACCPFSSRASSDTYFLTTSSVHLLLRIAILQCFQLEKRQQQGNCIIQHCGSRWPGTDATVNADRDEERRWGWRTHDFPAITIIPIDPHINAINISNKKNGLCNVRRQSPAKLTVKHFDIFPAEHRGDAFHQDQLVPICDIIWIMLQYFVNYLCIWIMV